jgi:L-2-hydroxyglutarate oxidase LhgO
MAIDHFDICIIGAGVIGIAIANRLSKHPTFKKSSVLLLEKNKLFGQETSSRNSEVIHAGIYYPKNSLKARLCVTGKEALYEYCEKHNIPFKRTGKLIIARSAQEHELESLLVRAQNNGVDDIQLMSRNNIHKLEPDIEADVALFSPSSGIIDSHCYMQTLLNEAEAANVLYAPLTDVRNVRKISDEFVITSRCQDTDYQFSCTQLINAAGLASLQVAANIEGLKSSSLPVQDLVKGSYFTLLGKSPFRHLIYPVPDKNLQGLGVHVTLDLSGQARFGPDTEKVTKLDYDVSGGKKDDFIRAISRYYPGILDRQLAPAYSGIRPKLKPDSKSVTEGVNSSISDFIIQTEMESGLSGLVQLFGIESPGLTASLAIADKVVGELKDRM